MNKRVLPVCFILMAFVSGPGVWAQTTDASGDHTAPSYDMKAQSLVDLERVQKKFVDLANALPADKMTWRPSTDSRSFAELFLHAYTVTNAASRPSFCRNLLRHRHPDSSQSLRLRADGENYDFGGWHRAISPPAV